MAVRSLRAEIVMRSLATVNELKIMMIFNLIISLSIQPKRSAIHSTKISGDFGPKLNGSVRSNRKSFETTGPPFKVDQFSRSDRLEFG